MATEENRPMFTEVRRRETSPLATPETNLGKGSTGVGERTY